MSRDVDPANLLVGEAIRGYQAAVDDFDRLVAEALELNRTDARCLEILMFDFPDGATPAQLGAANKLTSGSVTTMIDRLTRSGHVERRPHPDDGRRVVVISTPKARDAAMALHRSLADRGAQMLTRYSRADLATILDFFSRATALQREEEHILRDRLRSSES